MTLTTRVNIVISIRNAGFNAFYTTLLTALGMLAEDGQNTHLKHGLERIDQMKTMHARATASAAYKRTRKYNNEAKKKEQVLEERTSKPTGDYGSGIGFVSDDQDSDVEPRKKKKTGKRFCTWCDKLTNHTTWRSKHCVSHDAWKIFIQEEKGQKSPSCKHTKHANPPIECNASLKPLKPSKKQQTCQLVAAEEMKLGPTLKPEAAPMKVKRKRKKLTRLPGRITFRSKITDRISTSSEKT